MRNFLVSILIGLFLWAGVSFAGISENDILIVVNNNSPLSIAAKDKYRTYHPGVPADQVVYLDGIPDANSPEKEIITRSNFEELIASPIRQFLIDNDLVNDILVILTTAGLPYRIECTNYPNVIKPYASNGADVVNHTDEITAATVESELAILWLIDPNLADADDPNCQCPLVGALINPYHGYIDSFSMAGTRDMLNRRLNFRYNTSAPYMDDYRVWEGQTFSIYGIPLTGRALSARDIYLVCRFDVPHEWFWNPTIYMDRMLESAARVSDPESPNYHGYDPAWSLIVLDAKSGGSDATHRWYNIGGTYNVYTGPENLPTFASYPAPPSPGSSGIYRYHFDNTYEYLEQAGYGPDYGPNVTDGNYAIEISPNTVGGVMLYDPENTLMNYGWDANYGCISYFGFGIHQAGTEPNYIHQGGPNNDKFQQPVYGSVFNTWESYNCTTFFPNAPFGQYERHGLLADWLAIDGSAGIGHAFEPMGYAVAGNGLLMWNYLKDLDGDGVGDMCFIEAAYSAIPYLSWATVVVGDPLMRIHVEEGVGPGIMEPHSCSNENGAAMMATPLLLLCLPWLFRRSAARV